MTKISSQPQTYYYTFRSLKLSDFFSLHRMYDSLDQKKTKPLFNLSFLGLKQRSFKWYPGQVLLFFSNIKPLRKLMLCFYPRMAILSIVAEKNGVIAAYGFLLLGKRFSQKSSAVSLGIVVNDRCRKKGLGSGMMKALINLARQEKMKEIFLTTRTDNLPAQRLFKKFGFRVEKLYKNRVEWQGKHHDVYQMVKRL